jgi:hypothetical protein
MSKNYPLGSGLACSVAEESNTDTDSSDSVKNFKKKPNMESRLCNTQVSDGFLITC